MQLFFTKKKTTNHFPSFITQDFKLFVDFYYVNQIPFDYGTILNKIRLQQLILDANPFQ